MAGANEMSNSYDRFYYDDLDPDQTSLKSSENHVQFGSSVRQALIKKTEDRVANDLFKILDSILQKEVFSELIDTVTADDIFYNFRGKLALI